MQRPADAVEQAVMQVVGAKHPVKGRGELLHDVRPVQFPAQVAPARRHAIAAVFVGDVETADKRHRVVHEQELAVIAEKKTADGKRIEQPDFAANGDEFRPVVGRQAAGAEPIQQELNAHAGLRQRGAEAFAGGVRPENVHLEPDRLFRCGDGREHPAIGLRAGGQPADIRRAIGGRVGHAVTLTGPGGRGCRIKVTSRSDGPVAGGLPDVDDCVGPLAFAQEDILAEVQVGGRDGPSDLGDADVVQVDAAALDILARLALGRGEAGVDEEIGDRHAGFGQG